jgi:FAD/FMN-containing dehydrogenase/short-subunit dehydrogenase
MKKQVANWGLYPSVEAEVFSPNTYEDVMDIVAQNTTLIARGNGRCYGDASLASNIISTLTLNNIIAFNQLTGIIVCQSGVLLSNLLEYIVPLGFFLPISPGTKYITIGGAFASDIHGKNHHVEGVFSDYVISIKLILGDGTMSDIFPDDELFIQTAGGMGATGIIVEVTLQLKPIQTSYITQTSLRAKNLEKVFDLFETHKDVTYSVAWIDCLAKGANLGRSVLLLGEHALADSVSKKQLLAVHKQPFLKVPFYFPSWFLNPVFIKIFNILFYYKPSSSRQNALVHYDPYFYPLDKIHHWNKIYGKKGFIQYQFVVPKINSYRAVKEILEVLSSCNLGSFLAVLKLFGKSDEGRYLHFPMEGYTLAVDIKITDTLWKTLDHLDNIVNKYNGKVYLTKDARMSKISFEQQYQNHISNNNKFISHQMKRYRQSDKEVWLIIGANSDIAKATISRLLKSNPNIYFILLSRDIDSTTLFVSEFMLSNNCQILPFDIEDYINFNSIMSQMAFKPNVVFYAAGVLFDNATQIKNVKSWKESSIINFVAPIAIINALVLDDNPFLKRVIGISSIAGIRARKSNYLYGAVKSGFHQYLFGLRQDLKSRNVVVQSVCPGFVATKMTKHLALNRFANSPMDVANSILNSKKRFIIYPNLFWKILSFVIRIAPEELISKL